MEVKAEIAQTTLQLLYGLMPGFVTAWIFHRFTPHKSKPEQWEAIIQALLLTGVVYANVLIWKMLLLWIGKWHSFGHWTDECNLVWSYIVAVLLGIAATIFYNKDGFSIGRKWGFTKETSLPSEWSYAFHNYEWYVVLHLKNGKRLYGWPEHSPNQSDSGHFSITQPAWFKKDGTIIKMYQLERMLIPAADVIMVEMYKKQEKLDQLGINREQIEAIQKPFLQTVKESDYARQPNEAEQPAGPKDGE